MNHLDCDTRQTSRHYKHVTDLSFLYHGVTCAGTFLTVLLIAVTQSEDDVGPGSATLAGCCSARPGDLSWLEDNHHTPHHHDYQP